MTKQPHRPGGSPAGTGGQFDSVDRPRVEADLHVEHDGHPADRVVQDCMDRVRQHLEDFDDPHETERELGALINKRLDGQGDVVSAAVYKQCHELIAAAKARRDEMESAVAALGVWAHGGDVSEVASEWRSRGFAPTEATAWMSAGTFSASAADELRGLGVSPHQASCAVPWDGSMTVGYAVSNGDITADEAPDFLHD